MIFQVLPPLRAWGHQDFWVMAPFTHILTGAFTLLMVGMPLLALAGLLCLWSMPLGVYGRFCAFSTVRFLSYVQTLDIGVACLFGSTIIIPTFIKHLVYNKAQALYNV